MPPYTQPGEKGGWGGYALGTAGGLQNGISPASGRCPRDCEKPHKYRRFSVLEDWLFGEMRGQRGRCESLRVAGLEGARSNPAELLSLFQSLEISVDRPTNRLRDRHTDLELILAKLLESPVVEPQSVLLTVCCLDCRNGFPCHMQNVPNTSGRVNQYHLRLDLDSIDLTVLGHFSSALKAGTENSRLAAVQPGSK